MFHNVSLMLSVDIIFVILLIKRRNYHKRIFHFAKQHVYDILLLDNRGGSKEK